MIGHSAWKWCSLKDVAERLSQEETVDLLASQYGLGDPDLADRVYEATAGLPLKVHLTGPATRPAFHLEESDNPLWKDQQDGIDERRVDEYDHLI